MLPPIPEWSAAHPALVHLPIGILAVVPAFLLMALIPGKRGAGFAVSATILLILGSAAAWVAVASGESAADIVQTDNPAIEQAIHNHEETAELARTLFLVLAGVLIVGLLVSVALKPKQASMLRVGVLVAVLLGHLGSLVVLANAAHQGGLLVHHYNITAPIAPPKAPAQTMDDDSHEQIDDD